jgi:hypothetical protein
LTDPLVIFHRQIHYHAIFNNGKVRSEKIARTIAKFVLKKT